MTPVVLSEVRLSVYVCGGQFKENKTLKHNLSEGEESWHNDDKMLLLDLTAAQLFNGKKKILAKPKAVSSLCLLFLSRENLAPTYARDPGICLVPRF